MGEGGFDKGAAKVACCSEDLKRIVTLAVGKEEEDNLTQAVCNVPPTHAAEPGSEVPGGRSSRAVEAAD